MGNSIFFHEFTVFFALVFGWAIWELRKISKLHKKTLEEERAKAAKSDAPSEAD